MLTVGTHPKQIQEGSKIQNMRQHIQHQELPQGQGRQIYKLQKRIQSMAENSI